MYHPVYILLPCLQNCLHVLYMGLVPKQHLLEPFQSHSSEGTTKGEHLKEQFNCSALPTIASVNNLLGDLIPKIVYFILKSG